MDLLTDLKARGLINNITNDEKIKEFFNSKKFGMYIGFDPTAKSLHLGNYLAITILKRFANAGYQTFVVLGGATGMIGDPSGKKSERTLLSKEVLNKNKRAIKKQLETFTDATVFDNFEIYKKMNILDFLRDVGKSINVNQVLEREIVKKRLETGLSFTEFSYSIIQGYDFWYLYKNFNVAMQMGGSDQWANITAGVDFIRKNLGDSNQACGMTINLLTKADGTKFGKSEGGAIYLDKSLTSPYLMYQFLINLSDLDVEKLFYAFSFKSFSEIKKLLIEHQKQPTLKLAQKELTKELLIAIHGEKEYSCVLKISEAIFKNEIKQLSSKELLIAFQTVPTIEIASASLNIIDLLISLKVCPSKRQAKELIENQSIYLNGKLVDSFDFIVDSSKAYKENFSLLRKGKKNYYLIKFKQD